MGTQSRGREDGIIAVLDAAARDGPIRRAFHRRNRGNGGRFAGEVGREGSQKSPRFLDCRKVELEGWRERTPWVLRFLRFLRWLRCVMEMVPRLVPLLVLL